MVLMYLATEQPVVFEQNELFEFEKGHAHSRQADRTKRALVVPDLRSCGCSLEDESCSVLRERISKSGGDKELWLVLSVSKEGMEQDVEVAYSLDMKKQQVRGQVQVKGNFLQHLWQEVTSCYYNRKKEEIKFRIKVDVANFQFLDPIRPNHAARTGLCFSGTAPDNLVCGALAIKTDYMLVPAPISDPDRVDRGATAVQRLTWTNGTWNVWRCRSQTVRANVTIMVMFLAGLYPVLPSLSQTRNINERILKEEVDTNAVIVAGNGVKIKCHKSFLMVHSPVLKTMFESNMQEATTGTVEMPGMTEASVRALLSYLYFSDVTEAKNDCEIAFELMEAGHKYDIEDLVQTMKQIMDEQDSAWFTVRTALRLFLFARTVEAGGTDLSTDAVRAIRNMNMSVVRASPDYQQVFRECPEAAMDLFECLATCGC